MTPITSYPEAGPLEEGHHEVGHPAAERLEVELIIGAEHLGAGRTIEAERGMTTILVHH